jgi:hypothetical protein
MFQWFLNWLERKGRKSTIMDRDGIAPYLTRWYVAYPDGDQRQRKDIPFNAFIHRFWQSDEPCIHTHPWNWSFSIILKGGYWEHLPDKTIWRGRGSFRLLRPDKSDKHWIEIPKGQEGKVWTLFVRGRTTHSWYFIENGVWVPWQEYLDMHRKIV